MHKNHQFCLQNIIDYVHQVLYCCVHFVVCTPVGLHLQSVVNIYNTIPRT